MRQFATFPSLRGHDDGSALDRLDDRQLEDIGLERQGEIIADTGGRFVRRLASDAGFERALFSVLSLVHRRTA